LCMSWSDTSSMMESQSLSTFRWTVAIISQFCAGSCDDGTGQWLHVVAMLIRVINSFNLLEWLPWENLDGRSSEALVIRDFHSNWFFPLWNGTAIGCRRDYKPVFPVPIFSRQLCQMTESIRASSHNFQMLVMNSSNVSTRDSTLGHDGFEGMRW
jgi:hypothetical protein